MIDPAVASRIRLLVLDVDGVMTDNAIYLGLVAGERVELKRFDIQDGLGIRLLQGSAIDVAWLSGRASDATALRGSELEVATVLQVPTAGKLEALGALLVSKGLDWAEVAFVGDDLADLAVMERVGLPVAVANAVAEIRQVAHWTTAAAGGHGAVREVVEALLDARGEWAATVNRYRAR